LLEPGTAGFAGNDGPAINAQVSSPNYLAVDGAGNLYFAESGHIRKIDKNGRITSLTNYGVDGLAADSGGTLYYNRGNAVYKLAPGATADTLIAGDANNKGFLGDGGPALSARFQGQLYLAVDRSGNVFVGDRGNARVRKISNGIVTTIAGNGNYRYSGEGVLALTAPLGLPYGMAIDKEGSVYFSERNGYRVRKVKDGILTTFAGNGTVGFSGDGGPATQATINSPQGLAFDAAGNLYIADRDNGRIRKISPFGLITTFASGIGNPIALAFDASGNLLVARSSCCVERIDPTGKSHASRVQARGQTAATGDPPSARRSRIPPELKWIAPATCTSPT
jgi:sugar lactone lactonase YvrE